MKKINVSEATGPVLNWVVAKCQGTLDQWGVCAPVGFRPSVDWSQGGPIIEQMLTAGLILQARPEHARWAASVDNPNRFSYGSTALIAAMRCYVVSKLGDVVEVPEELLE